MTAGIFIDGAAGTTGLEIRERLEQRTDLTLVTLPEEKRKDAGARRDAINAADVVILCLPDDAAREAVALIDNPETRVIDASSAFRVADGWTYGFPELGFDVAGAARVSNPGCYPTGFLALVAPLVRAGVLPADWPFTVNAVSGYSGGGKALIARFDEQPDLAFRGYGYSLGHKHVPEMQRHAGLVHPPLFAPSVTRAFRGMIVEVPVPLAAVPTAPTRAAMLDVLHATFDTAPLVTVHDDQPDELIMSAHAAPNDRLDLWVFADPDGRQARLVAMLDNLGKGASGAAVQNLNLMIGADPLAGLVY
ncbi:N-acetyl-gamma-glutamyl-phosphate reductase [Sphingomonas sp. OV641]|uniref:N-acetyl-gamma-glutamyl-phosphate reductase n=1 Tax=Sphingomonas sp. OV641 TaxID=1881068 RepID=UPI0008BF8867|nr:N-acetyl-gamma-glutamyl-phosphate reductase [Sphingomonas sp. OV641]SEJ18261.1 N-acetyl-gamma-glutamyl-phosphate reductase [Sphingomonas sp. OV641]